MTAMRAEYEKQVDLLVVELERNDRPSKGDWIDGQALIEYVGDRPLSIEFVTASSRLSDRIRFAADRVGRDADTIQAIADAAMSNPDSLVTLDLKVHAGAHL